MKLKVIAARRAPALAFAASCSLLAMAAYPAYAQTERTPAVVVGPAPVFPTPIDASRPYLSGKLTNVTYARETDEMGLELKGLLTIVNSGDKTARQVRAMVYLSDAPTLKPGAEPVAIAPLANSYSGGNLKPKRIDHIRIKHRLPEVVPGIVVKEGIIIGEYLIIVLSADNFPADSGKQIIYGPIP